MQYLVSLGFLSVSIRRINLVSFGSDIELDQTLAILNVSVFLLDFVSFILVGVSFQKDLLQDYSDIVTLIYFGCMLIDQTILCLIFKQMSNQKNQEQLNTTLEDLQQ